MFWSLSIFTAAAVAGSPHHPPLSYHISILVMKQFDQCIIYIPVTGQFVFFVPLIIFPVSHPKIHVSDLPKYLRMSQRAKYLNLLLCSVVSVPLRSVVFCIFLCSVVLPFPLLSGFFCIFHFYHKTFFSVNSSQFVSQKFSLTPATPSLVHIKLIGCRICVLLP